MYCNGPALELSEAAAHARIVQLQPLIRMLAMRLCCSRDTLEELIQAGNVGALSAIQRFDPSSDVKLSSYAVPWILGEMRKTRRSILKSREHFSLEEEKAGEHQSLLDVLSGQDDVDIQQIDLRMAMQSLEESERILICLRYFRDKSQKETAILMRKSQAQISRMERRVLDRLKERLA